jgi:UDP-glucose 4-epimerase
VTSSSSSLRSRGPDPRPRRRSLVTGGSGFIGSHLVERLLERGDEVTVIDDLSTGRRGNLPAQHPRLRFIHADLRLALDAMGPDDFFDEVYHLAAAVGVGLVVRDPVGAIETNIEQTIALLHFAARQAGAAGGCATLLASSSEVYGKSLRVPFAEDDDVVYGPTTAFRWSYATSKAIDEYLVLGHRRDRGLRAVVARLFNTVGPRQVGDYGMVLPRFVAAAIEGKPLVVHSDGSQRRCFCDVRDVVGALTGLLDEPACSGGVFNVGSDVPVTINDLASIVLRVTGSTSSVRHVPYDEALGPGFEDPQVRQPDLSRIRRAIGFSPRIPLERTIADVAAWIRGGRS